MKSPVVVSDGKRRIKLAKIDPEDAGGYGSKESALEHLDKLRAKLARLQEALYAEHRQSLLIVLQAMDTGGKDGVVKTIFTGVNPTGVQVTSFKAPSSEERDHDYLWRIHRAAPAKGVIGIWNRSHYEDVLVVRVHELVKKEVWKPRYRQINEFERHLAENGTTIIKFFLHISKDEQKRRLQDRLDDPEKLWKFNLGDLTERKLWGEYQEAYEDAINACSTPLAPWHIVPADRNWVRNLSIMQTVVETLERMSPRYPKSDVKPASIVIR